MRGTPKRSGVNKSKSAGQFRHNAGQTHPANMKLQPRRGGWRL